MGEKYKNKPTSTSGDKQAEVKPHLSYNDLRAGIASEINAKFNTLEILAFEKSREDTISRLMEEFNEDTTPPTDLDLLYNYNSNINILLSKWIKKHARYSTGLEKNYKKLAVIEAVITQEYKRNPDAHNGLLLNDKEIKNLILINPERIELEEKINNTKAVIAVIEMAMDRLKNMSFTIRNALETLRIKYGIFNGNL